MSGESETGPRFGQAPRDPEELEAAGAPGRAEIPALTTVGAVHLTVSDLERSVAYYRRAVGLELLEPGGRLSLAPGGARRRLRGRRRLAPPESPAGEARSRRARPAAVALPT